MSLQLSGGVRDAQNDAIESTTGASAKLQLRTGAPPANCAAADTGTLLCEIALPADWLAASSGGVKAKSGTWQGNGVAASNVGHFRVKDSPGTTTHIQGTVTATGGGGDMTMDNVNVAVDQQVTVNTFQLTAGNA
jgi:hypothetical protein